MQPSFTTLDLIEPLQRALADEGYTTPTPIQAQSIPHLLQGKDLLGCAQTGTGKTAAFALPMLQYLTQNKKMPSRGAPRALILAPTRELAAQIGDSFRAYGKFLRITHTVIFGGVGQNPQVQALARGIDVLVATPGRLLDLMNQGHVRLDGIELFVLDEADRMLDMGFITDIKKIIAKLPHKRQSLFFSATMSPEIVKLANSMLMSPVHVSVTPQATTVEKIEQRVLFVDAGQKNLLLIELLKDPAVQRAIVFTQMKHVANKVAQQLSAAGIRADAIHGNKSQGARTQALENFRSGKVRVLVATDIAARGIDVEGITHVFNYELPNEPETYVHRIGRTARAGAEGIAISFCSAPERDYLRAIERLINMQIPVHEHPYHSSAAQNATGSSARPPPKQQRGRSHAGRTHRPRAQSKSPAGHSTYGAVRSHTSVKGHGKRPMRRY
jgi:ATP-dependent RNA helicase RhlE